MGMWSIDHRSQWYTAHAVLQPGRPGSLEARAWVRLAAIRTPGGGGGGGGGAGRRVQLRG